MNMMLGKGSSASTQQVHVYHLTLLKFCALKKCMAMCIPGNSNMSASRCMPKDIDARCTTAQCYGIATETFTALPMLTTLAVHLCLPTFNVAIAHVVLTSSCYLKSTQYKIWHKFPSPKTESC
eukprot:gnl/MRDRNA2_/MRDRNA2_81111_c0_seq1.p1 gnl/MRDRNA2_/MRDRNA2_81111_c0~~gnl/MRDRNA2_/MRDRNA2_81111_c0_seq1.p1  ORF type:complete len:123 (-),score=8.67 gnl/MRDRNA2_/MRDRNA2_81111_c0_seq1:9-377(-)